MEREAAIEFFPKPERECTASPNDSRRPSEFLRAVLSHPQAPPRKVAVMYIRRTKEDKQPNVPIAIHGLVADYLYQIDTHPTSMDLLLNTILSPELQKRSSPHADIYVSGHHYVWSGNDYLVSRETKRFFPFPFAQSVFFATKELASPIIFPCSLGEDDSPSRNNTAVAQGGRYFIINLEKKYRQALEKQIPLRFDLWH